MCRYLLIILLISPALLGVSFIDDFEAGLDSWTFMTGDGDCPLFIEVSGNPGQAGEYSVWAGNSGLKVKDSVWANLGLPSSDYIFFCDLRFLSNDATTKVGTRMENVYALNFCGFVVSKPKSQDWTISIAGPTTSLEPVFNATNLPAGITFNRASGEFVDNFENNLDKWEYSSWTSVTIAQVPVLDGMGISYDVGTNNGAVWPHSYSWLIAGLDDVNDYSFEADIKILEDNSYYNFANRLSGPYATDMLGVEIENGASSAWSLTIKGVSGVKFTSENLPAGLFYDYQGFNRFKIKTVADQMEVYLNDSLLWEGVVVGANSGLPGLQSGWGGSAIMDNVLIQAEPYNNGWNRFGIDISGTSMTVYLNDAVLWSGECNQYRNASGPIGIATGWTGNFQIDNVLITPKPQDCSEVWSMGLGWPEDISNDCHIDIQDLKILIESWLDCTNPEDPNCFTGTVEGSVSLIDAPENYLFDLGDTVVVSATLTEAPLRKNAIEFKLVDYYQNVIWQDTVTQNINSLPATITTSLVLPKKGIFRLESSIKGRNKLNEVVLGTVSTIPANASGALNSPFGIASILDDYHLGIAKKMGASWLRLHDMDLATYWAYVEPTNNVWKWRNEQIQLAASYGLNIMGGFEATPTWASNAPQALKDAALLPTSDPTIWREAWGYQPVNLNDVEDYVRQTVRNYKNYIKYWEIWNEPHVFLFWASMPDNQDYRNQLFVDMSQRIYQTAKQEDPACTIIGGGGINIFWVDDLHDMNMRKLFELGLLNYCDVFSIHGYATDNDTNPGSEAMANQMDIIRSCMATYSPVQRPIWMTESAFDCESFFSDPSLHSQEFTWNKLQEDTGRVVRGIVSTLAAGVDKFFWWRLRHWDYTFHQANNNESLVEYTKAPKATFYSYAALVERLHDSQFAESVDLGTGIRCKVFSNGVISTAVLWTIENITPAGNIDLSTAVSVYDIMGNTQDLLQYSCPLEYEPHYIVFNGNAIQLVNILYNGIISGI